jgi:SAM-dependent methyltransferase
MMTSEKSTNPEYDRWQGRYAGAEGYLFGEAPNRFLSAMRRFLPASGRALAVADGDGRNGVWLAQQGLSVLSLDFSEVAQDKARALADRHGVTLDLVCADVHGWDYPEAAFDVVVEIFAQFSTPEERACKWAGMRRCLRPGGILIVQGYTPKQLDYGTGGPRTLDKLYTADLLTEGFGAFETLHSIEEEVEMNEGGGHVGMSAVIGLVARKPV